MRTFGAPGYAWVSEVFQRNFPFIYTTLQVPFPLKHCLSDIVYGWLSKLWSLLGRLTTMCRLY